MRRLAQHALAGVGFSALVVTAAVAGLGSPAQQDAAIAVPAPVVVVSPVASTPAPSASPTSAAVDLALAADRAKLEAISRDADRARLVATKQSDQRLKTLAKQNKAIAAQQAKIKKAADAAAAKVAAEKAAQERAIASRGYEAGVTDPREMAKQILKNKFGYGAGQFSCFDYIISHESNWNPSAQNRSSGAYGLPQALPGSKMGTVASDWRTNPATQIIWGVQYMKKRYGSPCGAQGYWTSHHNY